MSGRATKTQRRAVTDVLIWIIISAIVLCSVYVSKNLITAYFHSTQSADWPSVFGTVLEKDVEHLKSSSNSSNYISRIRYTYTVGDKDHISDRMSVYSLSESYGTREKALELHHQLPIVGKAIQVFYKPDDPSFAIVYKYKKPVWRLFAIVVIMWLFSLTFLYKQLRD